HIISHSQVPSQEDTTKACAPAATNCGGRNHHDDPGPHWDWTGYLAKLKTAVAALPGKKTPTSGGQSTATPSTATPSTTTPSTTTPSKSESATSSDPIGTSTDTSTSTSTSTSEGTGGNTCISDGACNPGNDGSGLICVGGR